MPWTLVAANRGRGGAVINSTGANFLIASIRYYGSSSGFGNGLTSSANVWTLVGTTMDRGGQKMDTYVCDAPAYVGPDTSVQGSLTYFTCTIAAFVRPAGALTVGTPASATAASVSSLASGSLTPAADDALLVSWVSFNNDVGEATRPSGWQVGSSIASVTADGYGGAMSWLNQTTAAAVNPSWSVPTATDMLVRAVAFTVGAAGATAITLTGPSSGTVGSPSTNFTVGANGTITGTITVTPNDGGDGGTFSPTSVAISAASPTAIFTYTAANAGSPTATVNVTNDGGLTNPAGIAYSATAPNATQLVLSVPDAAGLSGFSGIVLSAAAPGAGVTVIATPTGISFNGSGQATINVTGLGIPVGQRRWVSVTNSTGDPAQSPAPVQAQGPVTAS